MRPRSHDFGPDLLLGILMDRDIRLNFPPPATSLSGWELSYLLARLTVDQIMTKAVITIGPHHDVLDGRRLAGIITEMDLVPAFAHGPDPAPV